MRESTFAVRWLPGADRLASAHRVEGEQFDGLSAVHWAAWFEIASWDKGTPRPPDRDEGGVGR
jgi:hypothetical protein